MRSKTKNIAVLITVLLFACSFAYGQPHRLVAQKIEELRLAGVDTIITYYEFAGNSYQLRGNYIIGPSTYIIWKQNSAVSILKASNYSDSVVTNVFDTLFKPIRIDNLPAYDYFIANIDSIKSQQLKPAEIKNAFQDLKPEVWICGGYATVIDISIGKTRYKKEVHSMDLDNGILLNADGSVRFKRESVNYNYNRNSTVYILDRLLAAVIIELEALSKFDQ